VGTLPVKELDAAFAAVRKNEDLVQFSDLIIIARPYWYKVSRKNKHRKIAKQAAEAQTISAIRGCVARICSKPKASGL
jgi:hypothetical protein